MLFRSPGKHRAYFRRFCKSDDPAQFTALVTKVTGVVCACPVAYRKTAVLGPGAKER